MPFKEDSYEKTTFSTTQIWKDKDNGYSGLGRDLLSKFELWALSQHATAIIGMFAPELDREEEARIFYIRNKFSIDHGNRLYKRLT